MKLRTNYTRLLESLTLILFCTIANGQDSTTFIASQDKHLQYEGRIGWPEAGVSEIFWAGSSVKIKFYGTGLKAVLKDSRGHNYFNVVIDDSVVQLLKVDTVKTIRTLAAGLTEKEHTVELFKRTDGKSGGTLCYGFWLAPQAKILPLVLSKRMIEFYGNSITVGSGINEGNFPGGDEDNYRSYAAVTARHFKARYSCIARSGIGLMVSWFSLIMAEMYNRVDPDDSTSKWDFNKATPQIVVIDLFQNDCALLTMPEEPQFKKRFGSKPPSEEFIINAYAGFVRRLRNHYPQAAIICTLGNMDVVKPGSPWPAYVEKAVASMNDKNIYTHFFRYKNTPDHPDSAEQQQMATSLIAFIGKNINW